MVRPVKFFYLSGVLLISALIVILYKPSLELPFRDGDQIGYLTELHGSTRLSDGLKLYDYGLSRIYAKGDEILFRPLLFTWLAVQNTLFGYHAILWNISNLMIHVLTLAALFYLLQSLQPGIFSLLFTLLVATLRSSVPLPLNQHLGGYLWGFCFYFWGLVFLYRLSLNPEALRSAKNWFFYITFTTVACFFYELIVPFSATGLILFAARFPKKLTPGKIIGLCLPFLIYAIAYSTRDFSKTDRLFYVDGWSSSNILQGRNAMDFVRYAGILVEDLITYVIFIPHWQWALAGVLFLIILSPALLSRQHLIPVSMRFFPLIILILYISFLSFMRSGTFRDYYPYFFYLAIAHFVYGLLDFSKLTSKRKYLFAFFIIFMIGFNFMERKRQVQEDVDFYKPMADYQNQIAFFADSRQKEPGFSFSISNPDKDLDPTCEIKPGYPDSSSPSAFVPTSEIIFARFFETLNPAYALTWNAGKKYFTAKKL